MDRHGSFTPFHEQQLQRYTNSVSLYLEQKVHICLLEKTSWVRHHDGVLNKEVSSQDLWLKLSSIPVLKIRSLWLSKGWLDFKREKREKKNVNSSQFLSPKPTPQISFYERKPVVSEEVTRRISWSEMRVFSWRMWKINPFHFQRCFTFIQR